MPRHMWETTFNMACALPPHSPSTVSHGSHSKLRSALQSGFPFLEESTQAQGIWQLPGTSQQGSNLVLCSSHPQAGLWVFSSCISRGRRGQ